MSVDTGTGVSQAGASLPGFSPEQGQVAKEATHATWKLSLTVTLALQETSAPICGSLGFRTVCNLEHLRWSPEVSSQG